MLTLHQLHVWNAARYRGGHGSGDRRCIVVGFQGREPMVVTIGAVLIVELAILPWTAHAYDAAAFLSHADRVYFGHVPWRGLWAFGSIRLPRY